MTHPRISPDAAGKTTIFCLHYLGGSARAWEGIANPEHSNLAFVGIDLAGFGLSAGLTGFSVAEMAQQVIRTVEQAQVREWALVGHSMGAKIAMAVARHVEDAQNPAGLIGMILVAGSPPSPEPMDEQRRERMKSWFSGDAACSLGQAKFYIAQNVGRPLPPALEMRAVEDVARMNRGAWLAWLDHGSREDWSERIGILRTPALLITGSEDGDLGSDDQSRLTMPHLTAAKIKEIPGTGHLLPLEAPEQVRGLIDDHIDACRKRCS